VHMLSIKKIQPCISLICNEDRGSDKNGIPL